MANSLKIIPCFVMIWISFNRLLINFIFVYIQIFSYDKKRNEMFTFWWYVLSELIVGIWQFKVNFHIQKQQNKKITKMSKNMNAQMVYKTKTMQRMQKTHTKHQNYWCANSTNCPLRIEKQILYLDFQILSS